VLSRHELGSGGGTAARAYLQQGGIPADQIAATSLGLVPPSARLRAGLIAQGYSDRELDASGLFADSRWPGSILGAWRNPHGAVTTLWTRTIDPDADRRYLYLRGAPRGGSIPYGLSDLLASGSVSDRRELALVEGVLDVHILRAHGIRSVAALGGSTITPDLFQRLADHGVERVLLALDNDAAGCAALVRAIDATVHAQRSPSVWIIDPDLYDTAKDPGDVIRTGGAEAWRAATTAPICAITWRALDLTGPIACSNHHLARRAGLNHAETWLATLPGRRHRTNHRARHGQRRPRLRPARCPTHVPRPALARTASTLRAGRA
jgi:DNA primase